MLLLALVPLVVWLVVAGASGVERGAGASFAVVLSTFGVRLWQLVAHAGLYLLTLAMVVAMFLKPRADGDAERQRIAVPTQLAFVAVMLAYALGLALAGGDAAPREMLLPVALVILISVSTLRRRVRLWGLLVAAICLGFFALSLSATRLAGV
jgi:hypothetical protein